MRYAIVSTATAGPRLIGRALPPNWKVVARLDWAVLIAGTEPPQLETLIRRFASDAITAREVDEATAAILLPRNTN